MNNPAAAFFCWYFTVDHTWYPAVKLLVPAFHIVKIKESKLKKYFTSVVETFILYISEKI
jgi:hypothetical protein